MKMISRRYKSLISGSTILKHEFIEKLLPIIKKNCTVKFNESIDLNFQVNVKQKKNDVNLRSVVDLPAGTGKKIKIGVICEEEKINEAKKSGADVVGSEDLINKISSEDIDFEKLIATPAMMTKLSKLGKILGPRGLMPNPKLGTVTNDITKAVSAAKSGQVEIKNDKDGNIALSIGKKNFSDEKLIKNFNAIVATLEREKPSFVKGNLIRSAFITSTMGISYKLKLNKNI